MKKNIQHRPFKLNPLHIACLFALSIHTGVRAQTGLVISDDFRQAISSQQWNVFDGACLTAGSMNQATAATAIKVPQCVGVCSKHVNNCCIFIFYNIF